MFNKSNLDRRKNRETFRSVRETSVSRISCKILTLDSCSESFCKISFLISSKMHILSRMESNRGKESLIFNVVTIF